MTDLLTTDVLVIGEGSAGQTAPLAASEEGCDVILLEIAARQVLPFPPAFSPLQRTMASSVVNSSKPCRRLQARACAIARS